MIFRVEYVRFALSNPCGQILVVLTQELAIRSIYFLDRTSNWYQACHDLSPCLRLLQKADIWLIHA
ncbi:MAG TPA: hypothetical protein VM715_11160 [Candidatus Acidoferrum sp.]|jgi:hypothetical protein|nr:hypothetical protein [Candidatus Acidoferrum sp.]